MKGINIFLVLLISMFFISNVSAVSHTGDVDLQLSTSAPDWSLLNGSVYSTEGAIKIEGGFRYKGIADAGTPETLVFYDAEINKEAAYAWADIPQNVGGSFALYNGGVFSGSGGITIHRVNNVDVNRVDIWYQFDDTDFIPSDSEITYDITLYASPISEYYSSFNLEKTANSYATQNVQFMLESGSYGGNHASWATGANSYVEYDYYGHFINEYNITLSGAIASTKITRDGLGQQLSSSKFKLKNSTGSIVYQPSSYSTTNSTHNHDNGSYYYYLDVENYGDVLIYDAIAAAGPSVGTIELNQSLYTEPELIQIDAELITYDFTNHVYSTRLYGNTGGEWGALTFVDYNESTKMENITKTIIADLDLTFYDPPLQIKAVLLDFNKLDYTTTELAESATVYYNPPDGGFYTFEGTVIDAGNYGVIPGATVSVTGTISQSDTTDSNGKFKLYLPNGIYTVTGSMSGYIDNVNEEIVIAGNISYYNIYLTQTSYTNHTINGVIKDIDTGYALQDVHIIFTNATDTIDAYSTATGYYSADGFAQSSTYTVRALKSGYYNYNGSVTTAASGATYKAFDMVPETATPTPTPTVLPTSTYPGGEGHEWTNDEIVTMLRVLVPGFFLLMLVFLLLAVMLGINGNNGNGGQRGLGLDEIWKR